MDTQKSIDLLNSLIEINNDRVEGYETAANETDAADLKSLFAELKNTSVQNLGALRSAVTELGGTPEEGTRVTGKFFRAWMDVKAALTGNNRHQILSSCEFGEDKALEVYEDILVNSPTALSGEQLSMIRSQQAALRDDHDKVKMLRDAVNA
ncbi:MAG TPA: PA2169 family four-helix-bundle protein [Haliscomenobacter sp.]|nr:PA2169 family four-helix-bundle protein [Haliscomenobacter sp.]